MTASESDGRWVFLEGNFFGVLSPLSLSDDSDLQGQDYYRKSGRWMTQWASCTKVGWRSGGPFTNLDGPILKDSIFFFTFWSLKLRAHIIDSYHRVVDN